MWLMATMCWVFFCIDTWGYFLQGIIKEKQWLQTFLLSKPNCLSLLDRIIGSVKHARRATCRFTATAASAGRWGLTGCLTPASHPPPPAPSCLPSPAALCTDTTQHLQRATTNSGDRAGAVWDSGGWGTRSGGGELWWYRPRRRIITLSHWLRCPTTRHPAHPRVGGRNHELAARLLHPAKERPPARRLKGGTVCPGTSRVRIAAGKGVGSGGGEARTVTAWCRLLTFAWCAPADPRPDASSMVVPVTRCAATAAPSDWNGRVCPAWCVAGPFRKSSKTLSCDFVQSPLVCVCVCVCTPAQVIWLLWTSVCLFRRC